MRAKGTEPQKFAPFRSLHSQQMASPAEDEPTVFHPGARAPASGWAPRGQRSTGGGPSSALGGAAAAAFRASFLACLRSRRSRTALSRLSLAIVVFRFELDAIRVCPFFLR